MRLYLVIIFFALLAVPAMAQTFKCMPDDVKLEDIVTQTTSVKQTLTKLRARCYRGKLVDRKNRQIRFYRTQGCWGNPPADYQEILEKQRKEIADLKKKYTLVEITCNPSGLPIG